MDVKTHAATAHRKAKSMQILKKSLLTPCIQLPFSQLARVFNLIPNLAPKHLSRSRKNCQMTFDLYFYFKNVLKFNYEYHSLA
jgi:hypothetical protein